VCDVEVCRNLGSVAVAVRQGSGVAQHSGGRRNYL
jgi:hypothetical protein